jgi:rhodanese-related sulfurtransferase
MTARPDTIDCEVAAEYLQEGRAQFVDARPLAEFDYSPLMIPGAIHVHPGSGTAMDDALLTLARGRLTIVYCNEPAHAASAQVARRVRELGLGDASVLEGGFRAWCDADLPTVANLEATRAPEPPPIGA